MDGAWWITPNDLDDQQRLALQDTRYDGSFIVDGPAGSGKTNLLLLKARWLIAQRLSNIRIVVFTGSLRRYLVDGCRKYEIPEGSVTPLHSFFESLISEHGGSWIRNEDFMQNRLAMAREVTRLIAGGVITKHLDALLIDEAQDYTVEELKCCRFMADRLVIAMDFRQTIYQIGPEEKDVVTLVGGPVLTLKYHYRSGRQLCLLADHILSKKPDVEQIAGTSHYKEKAQPSSVELVQNNDIDEQFEKIVLKMKEQRQTYPGELLGILFPTNEGLASFLAYYREHYGEFGVELVEVLTMHGAKGLEFRAVQIGDGDNISKLRGRQKYVVYTSILRGKTAAYVYYVRTIPQYIVAAFDSLLPPPDGRTPLDDLFPRG